MNPKMNAILIRRIIGFILTALLFTSVLILSGPVASAQTHAKRRVIVVRPIRRFRHYDPFWDPYWRYDRFDSFRYGRYVFSNSQKAFERGYKDGLKTGEKDGRKNKSYNPERSHYYHDAGFGNYGEVYRNGFAQGYRRGYSS